MGNNSSCCHKETKNGAIEVVEAKAIDLHVREASKESHTGTQAQLSVPCQQVRRRSEVLKETALQVPGQDSESLSHRDSVASGHTLGPHGDPLHRERSRSAILRTTALRVDTAIMRGIELHKSLWGFGRLWRRSPIDLKIEARAGLWEKSKPVQRYNAFLSHTWRTPGRWKVFSLLLRSSWKQILLGWILCLSVVAVLIVVDVIPMELSVPPVPGGTLGYYANPGFFWFPWTFITSVIALPVLMVIIPYLPSFCRKPSMCFLDVVSIHQTDEELMHRGIYGLGGFLTQSEELWVLWSPPYFTRLWCVFEMAAFHAANPDGKVRLHPIFLEKATMIIMFINHAFMPIQVHLELNTVLMPFLARQAFTNTFKIVLVFIYTHLLRKVYREKNEAINSLENFSLAEVHCRTDFDKEYILNAIREWYGDEKIFEGFVRHELREELQALSQMCLLPPQYLLFQCLAVVANSVDFTIGYYKFTGTFWNGETSPLPAEPMLAMFFGFTVASPLTAYIMSNVHNYLTDRWASPLYGCNYGTSCLIAFIFYILTVLFAIISEAAGSISLWSAITWGTVLILIASAQLARWHILKDRVHRKISRGGGHSDGKAM